MIGRTATSLAMAFLLALAGGVQADTDGMLDGRAYSGMIGPVENPDLEDSLYFEDGHFWSHICTRCGFAPGPYKTEETAEGVRFTGTLESDSRGRFDYDGLVRDDGSIHVSITWEHRRWYWTATREIAFVGEARAGVEPASIADLNRVLQSIEPDGNPMCARF